MGFNTVYRNLREVFPQIENRLLRAVAIEHPKDSDIAIEIVLTEIVPRLAQQKLASTSSNSGGSSERKAKFHPTSPVSLCNSNKKDSDIKTIADENVHFGQKDIVGHSILNSNMAVRKASPPVKQCSEGNCLKTENVIQQALIPAKESTLNTSEGNLQLVSGTCNYKISELTVINSTDAETVDVKEPTEFKDESALKPLIDGSGEVCRIDMLEGFAEDAKINEKTLASAVVLFTTLMKEIEIQEKEVEDVKKRATSRFLDILKRVEDLKGIMQHAKEANEMLAGEVYGEKAILDTEVRRLQSRMLNLSEKNDNTLGILDELHCELGERLAEAEKVMNKDEVELVGKEKLAKNAVAIYVKLNEESMKLNQLAEENTKLWEFLMDGRLTVDMLEVETSILSEDLKLLKGKLNVVWVPFGESAQVFDKEDESFFVPNEPSDYDTMKESCSSSKATDDEWDLCQCDP